MKNQHVMSIFAGAMLLYTAWRTFDYMCGSLQDVSAVVRLVVSIAFLAFSEIGLLVWLHSAQPNATTDLQETTAGIMIWVDFVGSMVVGLADLAKHNTLYTVDLTVIDPLLFIAPWAMVVLNVGGYLVYHTNDSEAKLDREERRLEHAEHTLEMEARRAAIKELRTNKQSIAAKLAPHYYQDIRDRVTGRTLNRFERQAQQLPAQANTPPGVLPPVLQPDDQDKVTYLSGLNGVSQNGKAGHPNGKSQGQV